MRWKKGRESWRAPFWKGVAEGVAAFQKREGVRRVPGAGMGRAVVGEGELARHYFGRAGLRGVEHF